MNKVLIINTVLTSAFAMIGKPAVAAPQVVAGRTILARLAAPTAGIPVLNQFYKYGEMNEEGYKT